MAAVPLFENARASIAQESSDFEGDDSKTDLSPLHVLCSILSSVQDQ
jgi:hypothetical protein